MTEPASPPWRIADLPQWVVSLRHVGFDPLQPWFAFYCTGGGEHSETLLGIAFDHPTEGRVYGGPGIRPELTDEAELRITAQEAMTMDDPLRTHRRTPAGAPGSVNVTCPVCDHTLRRTREQWSRIAENLPLPDRIDISELH